MRKISSPEISIGWQVVILGAFLLLYIFQAVSASTQESNTFDEALHLTTGYLYWTHSDTQLWPDNGIFAQAWASLPLLADHLKVSQVPPNPSREMGGWEQGYDFFYLMGNDPATMLFQGRLLISLLGAALGMLVFFWSKELFGTGAGFISLLLFIFCPTMLAHGALVTTDMAATLGFFSATFTFWKLTHVVSGRNLLFCIVCLGCLILSKMSSPLIFPIFLLILLVRLFSSRPIEMHFLTKRKFERPWGKVGMGGLLLLALMLAGIGILWFAYNFKSIDHREEAALLQVLYSPDFSLWSSTGMRASILENLTEINLLPPCYMEGLISQMNNSQGGYLWGRYYDQGNIWFFPMAFLIKTPIATLFLFFLALIAYICWQSLSSGRRVADAASFSPCPSVYDLSPLLILGGIYGLACLSSSLNIGHRHLMPIYPVLFVLAGANVFWLRSSQRIYRIVLGILLVGVMIESLSVRPHYLAFFNQFVGGPRYGYHYLIDSSLDWGQDLPGLRKWMEKNAPAGSNTKVYLSYFGTSDPEYYGIHSFRLPDRFSIGSPEPFPWAGGIYCISATRLQGGKWNSSLESFYQHVKGEKARWDATVTDLAVHESLLKEKGLDYWNSCLGADRLLKFVRLCCYLRQREPDDEVGYSILIYRLSDENVRQALEGSPPGL